jgi:hypothetical protein
MIHSRQMQQRRVQIAHLRRLVDDVVADGMNAKSHSSFLGQTFPCQSQYEIWRDKDSGRGNVWQRNENITLIRVLKIFPVCNPECFWGREMALLRPQRVAHQNRPRTTYSSVIVFPKDPERFRGCVSPRHSASLRLIRTAAF